MKFLLLVIGLSCFIAGVAFKKGVNRQRQRKFCIFSGALLILAYLIFWGLGIKTGLIISFFTITLIMVFVGVALQLKDFPVISNKLTVWQHNLMKWSVFITIMVAPVLFGIHASKLPSVALDNGVIHIGGRFGGEFKVSYIQSVDTVSLSPKIGMMRGGSGFFGSYIGNFDLENEEKTAKLCFYRNNPPFIKIRMNDNRLLLVNFSEPNKTLEFYNQIKYALLTN